MSFTHQSNLDEAEQMLRRNETELRQLLPSEGVEIFEKYKDCQDEVTQLSECETFIKGFRLGVQIAAEALVDGKKIN